MIVKHLYKAFWKPENVWFYAVGISHSPYCASEASKLCITHTVRHLSTVHLYGKWPVSEHEDKHTQKQQQYVLQENFSWPDRGIRPIQAIRQASSIHWQYFLLPPQETKLFCSLLKLLTCCCRLRAGSGDGQGGVQRWLLLHPSL